MRAFRDATDTCLAGYSGDIYTRMNLRLAAVIGGSSANLFETQDEAVAYIKEQQLGRLENWNLGCHRPEAARLSGDSPS